MCVPYISKKQEQLDKKVILLGLNYFFVGIYKEPQKPPYKTYIVVFWNQKFNLYNEQKLVVAKMKHEMEESIGGVVSKQRKVRELEKLPTPKELGKFYFLGCTHGSIWNLTKEEADWAKKVGLTKIMKLDWTLVDEPVVKKMINNYNHADQYVRLKGNQIDIGEGIGRIFGLSCERIVPIGKESVR
jgi:hypothetical protein